MHACMFTNLPEAWDIFIAPNQVEAQVELSDLHAGDEHLGHRERFPDGPHIIVPIHNEVDEPYAVAITKSHKLGREGGWDSWEALFLCFIP